MSTGSEAVPPLFHLSGSEYIANILLLLLAIRDKFATRSDIVSSCQLSTGEVGLSGIFIYYSFLKNKR